MARSHRTERGVKVGRRTVNAVYLRLLKEVILNLSISNDRPKTKDSVRLDFSPHRCPGPGWSAIWRKLAKAGSGRRVMSLKTPPTQAIFLN